MRIRGTPFITAVIMSAAAMFLIPETVHDQPESNVAPSVTAPPGVSQVRQQTSVQPEPSAPPSAAPARAAPGAARTLRNGPVNLAVNGFWSWALLDRRTGETTGSANLANRSDTASMIKAWIAADYLRRATERSQKVDGSRLKALTSMIRDSNNEVADTFHRANGGAASITRMVQKCGLSESRPVATGSWSTTEVSARDGARLAVCLADGRAAGAQWTNWVISEMRQVRGAGRFGIIAAFPSDVASTVAIKNGWINRRDGKWHIACLAVADEWALTVLTQYPLSLGFGYGTNICKQVAVQLGSTA